MLWGVNTNQVRRMSSTVESTVEDTANLYDEPVTDWRILAPQSKRAG